jgi:hypothetical protein
MPPQPAATITSRKAVFGLLILGVIDLLDDLDRYTVGGVLPQLSEVFGLRKDQAGLRQPGGGLCAS